MRLLILSLAAILFASCQSTQNMTESNANEPSPVREYSELDPPSRYDDAIARFTAADRVEAPPPGAVLFVGSSSIRNWHPRIKRDLHPIEVIPRGFGGSNMNDLIHFAEQIVYRYEPSAIVVYEGDNDTASGIPPLAVLDRFKDLVGGVRDRLPGTPIHFIAIKPSVARISILDVAMETNRLIKEYCDSSEDLYYIDIATPMLGEDGLPRPELFIEDNLHLNDQGYDLWTSIIRAHLLAYL